MQIYFRIFIIILITYGIYYFTQNYNCECKNKINESFSSINPKVLEERNIDKLRLSSVVSTFEAGNKCNPGYYEPKNPWK